MKELPAYGTSFHHNLPYQDEHRSNSATLRIAFGPKCRDTLLMPPERWHLDKRLHSDDCELPMPSFALVPESVAPFWIKEMTSYIIMPKVLLGARLTTS